MQRMEFLPSSGPSLGVEIELALVDRQHGGLCSAAPRLLEALAESPCHGTVKPELMQCYIELNTGVCERVDQAIGELSDSLRYVTAAADQLDVGLLWSATHPFSSWRDQQVTCNPRYRGLVDLLQDNARQLITFGLHVHVGVDSGDKAIMVCDRMLRYLPLLLAASANSPFWEGRATGLQAWRARVLEGLPTAGLPPFMRNWSEYVWLIHHLVETGFIQSIREIWWDIRPHHNFGTVEVRICDMPGSLQDTAGLVALIHCLVAQLSQQIDAGTYQHDCHPMLIRQNKWRAARYGLDAQLVDSFTHQLIPARESIAQLVDQLSGTADRLQCRPQLELVREMLGRPTWSQQQLERCGGGLPGPELVHWMLERSRQEMQVT